MYHSTKLYTIDMAAITFFSAHLVFVAVTAQDTGRLRKEKLEETGIEDHLTASNAASTFIRTRPKVMHPIGGFPRSRHHGQQPCKWPPRVNHALSWSLNSRRQHEPPTSLFDHGEGFYKFWFGDCYGQFHSRFFWEYTQPFWSCAQPVG